VREAFDWRAVHTYVEAHLAEDAADGLLVISDHRAVDDEHLLNLAAAVVWITAAEPECFSNCVTARVTLRHYASCVWPAHATRAKAFLGGLHHRREDGEETLAGRTLVVEDPGEATAALLSTVQDFVLRRVPGGQGQSVGNVRQALRHVASDPPRRGPRDLEVVRQTARRAFRAEAGAIVKHIVQLFAANSEARVLGAQRLTALVNVDMRRMSKEENAVYMRAIVTTKLKQGGKEWTAGAELIKHAEGLLEEDMPSTQEDNLLATCDAIHALSRHYFLRHELWVAAPSIYTLAMALLEAESLQLCAAGTRLVSAIRSADHRRYSASFADLDLREDRPPVARVVIDAVLRLLQPLQAAAAAAAAAAEVDQEETTEGLREVLSTGSLDCLRLLLRGSVHHCHAVTLRDVQLLTSLAVSTLRFGLLGLTAVLFATISHVIACGDSKLVRRTAGAEEAIVLLRVVPDCIAKLVSANKHGVVDASARPPPAETRRPPASMEAYTHASVNNQDYKLIIMQLILSPRHT
jgi:hypothetical protein